MKIQIKSLSLVMVSIFFSANICANDLGMPNYENFKKSVDYTLSQEFESSTTKSYFWSTIANLFNLDLAEDKKLSSNSKNTDISFEVSLNEDYLKYDNLKSSNIVITAKKIIYQW